MSRRISTPGAGAVALAALGLLAGCSGAAAGPGADAGLVAMDAALPGADAALPGADAALPGADAALPGADAAPSSESRATIVFPPPIGLTESESRRLVVRGTAADEDGIAAVRVNGIAAQTQNAFADWQATVPLSPGVNVLEVEVEDDLGNRSRELARAVTVLTALLRSPRAMALDPANRRALVMEQGLNALVAIDLDSGARTVLASNSVGDGAWPVLRSSDMRALAMDTDGARAVLVDTRYQRLLAIDLHTGARRVISGDGRGDGAPMDRPIAMVLDQMDRNRALVVDAATAALLAVDLDTGDRTIVSGEGVGTGVAMGFPTSVALAPAGDRALVVDRDLLALLAVDLDTGDRELLSDSSRGTGAPLWSPTAMGVDMRAARALVGSSLGDVTAVDLRTGDRSLLTYELARPTAIDVLPGGEQALVADWYESSLVVLDTTTGAWRRLAQVTVGDGVPLRWPGAVVQVEGPDGAADRLLVADESLHALLAVDLATGDRSVLSHAKVGPGPILLSPLSLAVDAARNRALVVNNDGSDALLAVDLATGERTVLSSQAIGSGPPLAPTSLVWDAAGKRVLGLRGNGENGLLAVDPDTGERTVLSDRDIGRGPLLARPRALILDADRDRVLVLDDGPPALLAIDLETGNRTLLSGRDAGTGPALAYPDALALDAARNRALVVNRLGTEVLAIDLTTGERTVLARHIIGPATPEDEQSRFTSVSVDAERDLAILTNAGLRAIELLDLRSPLPGGLPDGPGGDTRVIVSR